MSNHRQYSHLVRMTDEEVMEEPMSAKPTDDDDGAINGCMVLAVCLAVGVGLIVYGLSYNIYLGVGLMCVLFPIAFVGLTRMLRVKS